MIVELDPGVPLQAALRTALQDPSVELSLWLPERLAFVDEHGQPVRVPPAAEGRAVTFVDDAGGRIAALTHRAAPVVEPLLLRRTLTAAAPSLRAAQAGAQLLEVRASRARIVAAADAARRRVERELHDGPQQRLLAVALVLRLAHGQSHGAHDLVEEAGGELAAAMAELRELARSLYPVLLTDAGLGPALVSLVERCAVPTRLHVVPERRLDGAVERTCYVVAAEALSNVTDHARAGSARVAVYDRGGRVDVEVSDDGVGGADPSGPGLRGLADRVAAHGGTLRVVSPLGGGTRVLAGVPCG